MSNDEIVNDNVSQRLLSSESSDNVQVKDSSPKPRAISPAKRKRVLSHVEVANLADRDAYEALPGRKTVHKILEEFNVDDEIYFQVCFGDFHEERVRSRQYP